MKKINSIIAVLIFAVSICGGKANAQARSNISFSYGVNKPLSGSYNWGTGVSLQGDITIANKVFLSPALGIEYLKSAKLWARYTSYYDRIDNVGLGILGVSGKYYIAKNIFAALGPILYLAGGNEDLIDINMGGAFETGYNFDISSHSMLALKLGADVVNLSGNHTGITTISNIKIAYAFNFKSR